MKSSRQKQETNKNVTLMLRHRSSNDAYSCKQGYKQWFEMLPSDPTPCTFTDEEFEFGILHHLQQLESPKYDCYEIGYSSKTSAARRCIKVGELNSKEFEKHLHSCLHCASRNRKRRHDAIAASIYKQLKYQGLHCRLEPKEIPNEGNDRGGPDISVRTDKHYVIDVTVSKPKPNMTSSTSAGYSNKKRKYASSEVYHDYTLIPFVVSVFG
jgi:hypothetical protein